MSDIHERKTIIDQFIDNRRKRLLKEQILLPPFAAPHKEIATLEAENAKLKADIQCMVEKAADKHLAGYREMGAKLAKMERRNERLKAEISRLGATVVVEYPEINKDLQENCQILEAENAKLKKQNEYLARCVRELQLCLE